MKTEIWKNVISDNLKDAIMKEVYTIHTEETKQIMEDNKRLLDDNSYKLKLIKRLKAKLIEEKVEE